MGFYDVPVNQSVPTEANRGLTSYRGLSSYIRLLKEFTDKVSYNTKKTHVVR
jgi:hypothetical protein